MATITSVNSKIPATVNAIDNNRVVAEYPSYPHSTKDRSVFTLRDCGRWIKDGTTDVILHLTH